MLFTMPSPASSLRRPSKLRRELAVRPAPTWPSAAIGAVFLAVYLALAPAVAGDKDSSEFTAVLGTLGLAHPTGYVPYTLLGHGWVLALHALGAPWAFAANAWSALGGAVAIGLWHSFAARLLARQGVGARTAVGLALLPALAFGLNPAWTSETTLAEVNSWHLAWVAAACLFASDSLEQMAARRGSPGWLLRRCAFWGVLAGLGVAHHATSVWFTLPLTVALLANARPVRPAWLACGAGAALFAPLASWSYVLWRSLHPAAVQWAALGPGMRETWAFVTGAGYRHYLGGWAPAPPEQAEITAYILPWLVGALLALLTWALARGGTPRALRVALLAAAALQTAYAFSYGVADPTVYFLPVLAVGLFAAPAALARLAAIRRHGRTLSFATAVGVLIACALWTNTAIERRASMTELDGLIRQMWNAIPIRRGYVIWDDDMHYRLIQYQQFGREKPELVIVQPRLLMDEGARQLFARAHGFDPLAVAPSLAGDLADSPASIRAFADRIAQGINRSSRDSVILFLPQEPSVRLLKKPGKP